MLYLLTADSYRENFKTPTGIVFNPLVALGIINKVPLTPNKLKITAFVIQGDIASELLLGRLLPPSRYKIFQPMSESMTPIMRHGIINFTKG